MDIKDIKRQEEVLSLIEEQTWEGIEDHEWSCCQNRALAIKIYINGKCIPKLLDKGERQLKKLRSLIPCLPSDRELE